MAAGKHWIKSLKFSSTLLKIYTDAPEVGLASECLWLRYGV